MEGNKFLIEHKSKTDKFVLIPIGDIHIGNIGHDQEFFEALMDWIYRNKNVYIIGMGDYVEADFKNLPWHSHETAQQIAKRSFNKKQMAVVSIAEQFKKFKEYMRPLAKEGRIIGLHEGNHDNRTVPYHGYNFVAEICEELGVKFLGHSAITRLTFKRYNEMRSWDIFSTHGKGAGTTPGSKTTKIVKMQMLCEADLYLHGDMHDLISYGYSPQRMNAKGVLEKKQMMFVNTGSFVNSYVEGAITYSERKDYTPVKIGCPKIEFIPHNKVMIYKEYNSEGFKEWKPDKVSSEFKKVMDLIDNEPFKKVRASKRTKKKKPKSKLTASTKTKPKTKRKVRRTGSKQRLRSQGKNNKRR